MSYIEIYDQNCYALFCIVNNLLNNTSIYSIVEFNNIYFRIWLF